MLERWRDHVATDWVPALASVETTLSHLAGFLSDESSSGRGYLPAPQQVLRALETPLAEVRVLVVGQDPYPTPGDATGLAFAVAPGRPLPRSLANIADELRADTGDALADGDLSHWSRQGVMLLNRTLTVTPGQAGSHRGRGWEHVTDAVIAALATRGGPLVAVLWGRQAQSLAPALAGVPTIESAHPSPLSARRGFFGSRPFSRTNALLAEMGAPRIRWGNAPPMPGPVT